MANKSYSSSPVVGNDEWEIQDALRVIQRAHEISKDAKMMAKVKKAAAAHADTMATIAKKTRNMPPKQAPGAAGTKAKGKK
jgi:hypothetical protein